MIEISDTVKIGKGMPTFIIAEAGVNHNGDMELAKAMIDIAVDAGADAVKFQTFKAENLASKNARKADYQLETTDVDETQLEMLKRLELRPEQHITLIEHCSKKNILFLSTAFDSECADLLDSLEIPLFKIPSGEVINIPFLKHVARKGKPMILSTGMSYLGEIEQAVNAILETGNQNLILLHCVTNYPAEVEDINLRAIQTMERVFNLPVGYSDHTLGVEISIAAVALGACVIEKHYTLDKDMNGPDHKASLEPDELKALVKGIRNVEKALGNGIKKPARSESSNRQIIRKSLVAACDIDEGVTLTEDMILSKRPCTGISPVFLETVIGRKAARPIKKDEVINWDMV